MEGKKEVKGVRCRVEGGWRGLKVYRFTSWWRKVRIADLRFLIYDLGGGWGRRLIGWVEGKKEVKGVRCRVEGGWRGLKIYRFTSWWRKMKISDLRFLI